MEILFIALSAVLGYLIGSINSALVIGGVKGVDIRTKGSGNAGATNAVRVLGKKTGILVFFGDFLKGILACFVGFLLQKNQIYAGVFAVIGHVFPIYYGFKGGKGISTILGTLLFLDWKIFLITGVWMLLFIGITKIVSVSTLSGLLVALVLFAIFYWDNYALVLGVLVLVVLSFVKHRENIKRLLNGTENKFGKKKE